jgi:hypothetical protein
VPGLRARLPRQSAGVSGISQFRSGDVEELLGGGEDSFAGIGRHQRQFNEARVNPLQPFVEVVASHCGISYVVERKTPTQPVKFWCAHQRANAVSGTSAKCFFDSSRARCQQTQRQGPNGGNRQNASGDANK